MVPRVMKIINSTKRSWARAIAAAVLSAGGLPAALSLAACSGATQSGPQAALPAGSPEVAPEASPAVPPQAALQINRAPIDTALKGFIERGQIAGAEAIVFKDGREVYYGSFGFADREAQRAMSRDALIQIYSMSKPVTGVALMQLHEQGLFQLDDPLSKYLPEFAKMKVYVGEDAKGAPILEDARRPITVRDITRHTAGFGGAGKPGLEKLIKEVNPTDWKYTLTEMSERLAKLPLGYHPGERWLYSAAVDVQARLVEKLSGVPYEQYAKQHVLGPLGMSETSFYVEPARQGRRAAEYQLSEAGVLTRTPDEEAFRFSSKEWPMDPGGFGWTSTIDDYSKFARMLLGEGEFGGVRVLKPETVRLMATNHLDESITERSWLPSKGQVGFGIDFAVRLRPPVDAKENPGEVGEFFWDGRDSTLFWVDPKNHLTAVLLVQLIPFDKIGLHRSFRRAVYDALAPT
jgi:CubicO group peptidase (beta-lactamase class C family)